MAAQQVQFVYLSQTAYDGLSGSHVEGRIYFTSDTHRIYRGSELYATATYDELSGLTSSSIYRETATFGSLTVTGDVTMSVSEMEIGTLVASDILVNGSSVSLVGHTHSSSDISDFTSAVVDAGTGTFASASHGHAISDITGLDSYVQAFAAYESRIAALESMVSGLEQALHSINTGA